ncbi:MAG: threonine-phosphate decarboxylase [Gammaproteobacteria bacterium]|nr:threonine-phosphate decarboxylase [Gammaproteobacteria bacterium]
MIEHGGRLRQAAQEFGIPIGHWLDLSTGISPHSWPLRTLPEHCWQRLPEDNDGLELAAAGYYGSPELLPVAGSQAAIQALPRLRPPCRVGVVSPGYAEHAAGWRAAGHQVELLHSADLEARLPQLDVLVVINPNNPTGERFAPPVLLAWRAQLAARGGWLVVDEAFIDCTPASSLVPRCPLAGLIVLRSLGKFFGLAGARVGFVWAEAGLRRALAELLGPWAISGPARQLAMQALADQEWQHKTRLRLLNEGAQLAELLIRVGLRPQGGTALYQWVTLPAAADLHRALARQAILVRLFTEPASLRFGLPADRSAWQRLEQGLVAAINDHQDGNGAPST